MIAARRTSRSSLLLPAAVAAIALIVCVIALSGSMGSALGSPVAVRARSATSAQSFQQSGFMPATRGFAPSNERQLRGSMRRSDLRVHGEKTFSVDKPLGLSLSQGANGLVVKGVSGNAEKAGIKKGDNVIYTSSFFGDELWPSDKLSFTQSAIKAAPSPVTIITSDEAVNVKRLNKRPAPKRFGGKKLSQAQKDLATHLCLDCGWIYCEPTPFEQVDPGFVCPQCNAGKKRFGSFDVETGKITEPISTFTIVNLLIVALGLGAVGFLAYFGAKLS